MKQAGKYDFQFSGLKLGKHQLKWEIAPSFFDQFEGTGVVDSDFRLDLAVDKKERLMTLTFSLEGRLKVACDRCNDPLWLEINGQEELVARFANETDFSDDKVIFLGPSEYKIDLTQFIYEFAILDLPLKRIHEEGKCNPNVIGLLSEEETEEEKKIDPRWEALKNIQKQ